ncbi:MAG: glutamate--tRNA ligase [bacterium]|nr:glutamate--tRNA ligase [candidate division KSB1 bacterium]MDH7561417.1 glutamate--tRNA ligase [bacterium]
MTKEQVRVRFAPSPTGFLHVGGLRTALFNFLFARRHGGVFVLRIEDTDRTRYVEGATENLIEMLRWAGLEPDEGPDVGGPYGPYVQSQRLDIYRHYAQQLLATGHAYYAFDDPASLEKMRQALRAQGRSDQRYDRAHMCNSLTLSDLELRRRIAAGEPYVVRLLVPEDRVIAFEDVVRGRVEIHSSEVDDQVLLKSDGYPTYHLANVVDDYLMAITHVIRGEEWLSSVPKHVLLYEGFGWQMPVLAHLPLIFNPDGSKMSKRDMGKPGQEGRRFDPDVATYRNGGYLREALINYLALLGWNPGEGDERQIFTLEELIREFSLERVNKARAIFDLTKLQWINAEHIKRRSGAELAALVRPVLEARGIGDVDELYLRRVVALLKERVRIIPDFVERGWYFFRDPETYEEKAVKKYWSAETAGLLREFAQVLAGVEVFTSSRIEEAVRSTASRLGVGAEKSIHPMRLAVSGVSVGPGLFELLEVLGKEAVLRRIWRAAEKLG